jgi:hypothetical protein
MQPRRARGRPPDEHETAQHTGDRDPQPPAHRLLEEEERDDRDEQHGEVLQQQRDADRQPLHRGGIAGLQQRDAEHAEDRHHDELAAAQPERRPVEHQQERPCDHGGAEHPELGELGGRQPGVEHDLGDASVRAEEER